MNQPKGVRKGVRKSHGSLTEYYNHWGRIARELDADDPPPPPQLELRPTSLTVDEFWELKRAPPGMFAGYLW